MATPNPSMVSPRQQAINIAREVLSKSPVYVDTETTGLNKNAEIVEITVIDTDGSTLVDTLIKPRSPIPPEVTRIHNITNEMVQTAPSWLVMWQSQIRSAFFGRMVCMYNEEFDARMIYQTNKLYGIPIERLNTFCLMKLFAKFQGIWDRNKGSYKYHRLEDAGRICKIPIPNSHRSKDDTLLARALLEFMAHSS